MNFKIHPNSELFKWLCPVDVTHKVIQTTGGNWCRCTVCKITLPVVQWKQYEATKQLPDNWQEFN